jgi:hypothetical protein
MTENTERTYKILVYGIERKGLSLPEETYSVRNYSLSFEKFKTPSRFNDFDGVILFQGTFETFKLESSGYASYLKHTCDQDELDKRKKEASLLMEQGGFICFLLDDEFIDQEDRRNFKGSDLTKSHLNYSRFYRKNFIGRKTDLNIKSDDFRAFLRLYGAANSYFESYNDNIDLRVLAEASGSKAGMIINRNNYFIPTLVPDNRPEILKEYFMLVSDGLTSSYNKLQISLPDWIKKFAFDEESTLDVEQDKARARLKQLKERTDKLEQFKSILALTGDELVKSVICVFSEGFRIGVDSKDELREDFKLLNSASDPLCLCEVKGTNRGVKREHINQADSHRERSGFGACFPSILIINTHIKNARSIIEKDQEIANEQIKHATNMNVLIMRTVDLLGMLRMFLMKQLELRELEEMLISSRGWLRVEGQDLKIIDGSEPDETALKGN